MRIHTFYFILIAQIGACLTLDWKHHNGKDFVYVGDKMNWFDAQVVCQSLNGRLTHVESYSENAFLVSLTDKTNPVWIGGADIHQEGDWMWYNPLTEIQYNGWSSSQPRSGRVANCLCFYKLSDGYKWADESCDTKYSFLCERIQKNCDGIKSTSNHYSDTSNERCMKICL